MDQRHRNCRAPRASARFVVLWRSVSTRPGQAGPARIHRQAFFLVAYVVCVCGQERVWERCAGVGVGVRCGRMRAYCANASLSLAAERIWRRGCNPARQGICPQPRYAPSCSGRLLSSLLSFSCSACGGDAVVEGRGSTTAKIEPCAALVQKTSLCSA
jgi:hypothetical protein